MNTDEYPDRIAIRVNPKGSDIDWRVTFTKWRAREGDGWGYGVFNDTMAQEQVMEGIATFLEQDCDIRCDVHIDDEDPDYTCTTAVTVSGSENIDKLMKLTKGVEPYRGDYDGVGWFHEEFDLEDKRKEWAKRIEKKRGKGIGES